MSYIANARKMRPIMAKAAQFLSGDDALQMKSFYPDFDEIIGQKAERGFKFQFGGCLWETTQPELTIQAHFPPGVGMESMYTKINETHAGTLEDPIPYSGNMALGNGKYYVQDCAIYLCNRDTVNPVYAHLNALGDYVTAV